MSLDRVVDEMAEVIAGRVVERLAPMEQSNGEPDWRLLNLEQAAERLGRSTRWVRERVRRGELPYVRLDGSAFAFELDDLQAFARRRRVDGMDDLRTREVSS